MSKKYNIYFKEGEDYHEVTDEEMIRFIDKWEEFKNGKREKEPSQICLIARNKTDDFPWTAIDNRTNDCWTEAFKTKEEAIYWLQNENYDPYEEKERKEMKKVEGKREPATLELLKLVEENPELPIIAEVNSDVVEDDCCMSWFGEVIGSCVDYVWTGKTFDGMYRTWTLNEALIERGSFVKENAPEPLKQRLEKLNYADSDKAVTQWIKLLPWKKAIIVYVDVPDSISPEPEI